MQRGVVTLRPIQEGSPSQSQAVELDFLDPRLQLIRTLHQTSADSVQS